MSDRLNELTNLLNSLDIELARSLQIKEVSLAMIADLATPVGENATAEILRLTALALQSSIIENIDSAVLEGLANREKIIRAIAAEKAIAKLKERAANLPK